MRDCAKSRFAGAAACGRRGLLGTYFLVSKASNTASNIASICFRVSTSLSPGRNANAVHLFFSFYFVATGLHAVHVAVGIAILAIIGLRARQNSYSDRYHSPITVAGLYWHFVDVVWIFLFALIYLPGRSG